MRKIQHAPYLRPLAWTLLVALVAGFVGLPAQPAAAQGPAVPTVAVVQVVNQSGSNVQNLANRAAAALNAQLTACGKYKVLGQSAVDQALIEAGVRLPLRPDVRDQQLMAIAKALRAQFVLTQVIDSIEVDPAKQLAAVKSRLTAFSRTAEGDLTVVETTAFNLARSNNEAVLIDDAIEQNAIYAVKDLNTNFGMVGKVLAPPIQDSLRISMKDTDCLREGAQFALLRNGVKYAVCEMRTIHPPDAECQLIERTKPAIGVGINDEVVLYKQGRGKFTALSDQSRPLREVPTAAQRAKDNTATFFGAVAGIILLGLGVWLVLDSHSTKTDKRTPTLVSPPNNSSIQVDTNNNLVGPTTFTATSIVASNQLVLQFATDAGFKSLAYTQTQTGSTGGGTGTGSTTGSVNDTYNSVTFTPVTTTGFLAPGTYYWRIQSIAQTTVYTSNVFVLTVVRQGSGVNGGAAFLRSPDTVQALQGSTGVEIQWSPVTGATGYQVWRRLLTPRQFNSQASSRIHRPATGSDIWLRTLDQRAPRLSRRASAVGRQTTSTASLAGFSKVNDATSTALSYTDSTVQNGNQYQWVVLTLSSATTSTPLDQAQSASFVTLTPLSKSPPATPANLTATPGDGQVTLTWTANSETDLAGYQVFRSTSANGNFADVTNNLVVDTTSPAAQGLSAGPGTVTVTDRKLTNGVQMYYRIRAVQLTTTVNGKTSGGLVSALSDPQQATPTSAPPQSLQVTQPPNGSTTDADRPELAWSGVTGGSQYTIQISTDATFPAAGLISTTATQTDVIYPASLPALTLGTTYYIRIGIFDSTTQSLRFGPTSSFIRGAVQRFTTTVTTTYNGAVLNGARVSLDQADTGNVTPAQIILSPKANNVAYTITAVMDDTSGNRLSGTVSYRPGIDSANVLLPLNLVGQPPATPTGLAATGQTDRIVLRWNPDPGVTTGAAVLTATYSIRRRANTAAGQYTEISRVTAPQQSASQLTFTDFNVTVGTRYYYEIVGISAAGVESVPSVTADAVAGVGAIQVLAPQDNQSFDFVLNNSTWTDTVQFAWVAVPSAARYIFEVGTDPNLSNLLADGNQVIAAGASPQNSVTFSGTAAGGFIWDGSNGVVSTTLYWRVIAVDEQNKIINQTEARRFFQRQPTVQIKSG